MGIRIGSDTGGTHTDLVMIDDEAGSITTLKVPTTPEDLGRGIVEGIKKVIDIAGRLPEDVARFVYGTTLVTNLIVEEQQIDVGFITTKGFRDVLEIGRASRRPNIYDIHWRPAAPLIPRHMRLAVTERIAHDGTILTPLDEDEVRRALDELAAAGVRTVAVCLLNSYANPLHERRIREIACETCPDLLLSLSCDVAREFREFERSSTTAINAFVTGPIGNHLNALGEGLKEMGLTPAPYIIRSNGGVISFDSAKRLPAALTHSGPMGGIIGGAALAERAGVSKAITLDLGGTSADVSLIVDGKADMTTRSSVGRHPLLLPMLDLVTIGAGGGSIAWVEEGGALRVGPRSAGSVPGPACYGQGGVNPTMTDANLFAGRLNPDYFLAGARKLYPDRSQKALQEKVAGPCGMTSEAAAIGILAIAEAHMVNAIKMISVQRGLDPRDFSLIGFGGAGPLHTLRLAEELGVTSALIPPAPGNLSALGMLTAQVRHDLVLTRFVWLDEVDPEALAADLEELLQEGWTALSEEDVEETDARFVITVDLRYEGQNYELNLPVGTGDLAATLAELPVRFHERHRHIYGYDNPEKRIQMTNLRLAATGSVPKVSWPRVGRTGSGSPTPVGYRDTLIDGGTRSRVPVFRLADMAAGQTIEEPAIVEYPGSTLFIPPDWSTRCDDFSILHLTRAS